MTFVLRGNNVRKPQQDPCSVVSSQDVVPLPHNDCCVLIRTVLASQRHRRAAQHQDRKNEEVHPATSIHEAVKLTECL